jgi:hypothetical protein
MKNKQLLVNLIVVLALFGFVASSVFMFYKSFELLDSNNQLPKDYLGSIKSSLTYITSGLTGLVGGIVATAFGVKLPPTVKSKLNSIDNYNLKSLGRMVSASPNTPVEEGKGKLGFLYALAYIIIGVISIAIWIYLGDNTISEVSNMATTFFGMMIPIVASFFNNQN